MVRDGAVTTIEGIAATPAGAKVQKGWLDLEVIQCRQICPGSESRLAALRALQIGKCPDHHRRQNQNIRPCRVDIMRSQADDARRRSSNGS
jgi:aerobic-type carbon monoxide dehydrogenase small subunit (CoxS/CutS family)